MANSSSANSDLDLQTELLTPGGTGTGRRFEARPLSAEERARGEQLAGRLQSELRRLVAALPDHARNATGMSRHLGIVRNTCQRVVSSIAEPQVTASLLARLPGVEGLHQFLEAVRKVGISKVDASAAEAAVEQYRALIREMAGSQSRLAERLNATADPDAAARREDPLHAIERYRKHLFTGAALVTGRQCDVDLSIKAYKAEREGSDALLTHGEVFGWVNATARPDAAPFFFGTEYRSPSGDTQNRSTTLLDRSAPEGGTPQAIIPEFTSNPPPTITSRQSDTRMTYIVDPKEASPSSPMDLVAGVRSNMRVPLRPDGSLPHLRNTAVLIEVPARHLIMDVYLHRDMATRVLPAFEFQVDVPRSNNPNQWVTALPNPPRLELLGQGTGNADTPVYPRQTELTRYLFDQMGWEPGEFVGYRCNLSYPLWRVYHTMFFRSIQQS